MAHHDHCFFQSRFHTPASLYMMLSVCNVLLVFNSSVNFVVYSLVEETFRKEAWDLFGGTLLRATRNGLRLFFG